MLGRETNPGFGLGSVAGNGRKISEARTVTPATSGTPMEQTTVTANHRRNVRSTARVWQSPALG